MNETGGSKNEVMKLYFHLYIYMKDTKQQQVHMDRN